jgi:HlyD family secretion protein
MRANRKRVVWVAAIAVGLTALASGLKPAALLVETAVVSRGPLQVTVDEEGVTRLSRHYVVTAPVAGLVRRIDLEPGDRVSRGDAVAMIAPPTATPIDARTRAAADARIRAADAVVTRAHAELERARLDRDRAAEGADRAKRLFDTGYASRESVDVAITRWKTAEQSLEAAASAAKSAEFAATEARTLVAPIETGPRGPVTAVRAPTSGVVLRRLHESEAVVAAGAPLLEIGDLQDLEVVADLLTPDAVRVRPGAAAVIDRWGGDRDLPGRVRSVEPAGFVKVSPLGIEEQRVNVVVRIDDMADMPLALGDGFRVWVHIIVWEAQDVLRVPTTALFRDAGTWAAFVLSDGRLAKRHVTIGERNEREAQVITGVSSGDVVVLYPGASLSVGSRAVSK